MLEHDHHSKLKTITVLYHKLYTNDYKYCILEKFNLPTFRYQSITQDRSTDTEWIIYNRSHFG